VLILSVLIVWFIASILILVEFIRRLLLILWFIL